MPYDHSYKDVTRGDGVLTHRCHACAPFIISRWRESICMSKKRFWWKEHQVFRFFAMESFGPLIWTWTVLRRVFLKKRKIHRFTCFLTTSGRTACCSWKHLKRMLKIYKIRFQILFHACSNLETAWPLYAYTTEDFSNTKTFSDHPLQIKHMHSAFQRIIMLSILTLSCSLRKNGH